MSGLRTELERKSTEELFAATLEGEHDDEAPWEAVTVLRLRGTRDVFETAKVYCALDNPRARERGLQVLAQLGAGKPDTERPFIADSVSIAIDHLQESDATVVSAAAWALSHLGSKPAVMALIGLRNHPDPDIRQAIACCHDLEKYPEGGTVLFSLMEDEDDSVRDWATFAVGIWNYFESGVWQFHDAPEVRAALRKRLRDPFDDARREAIWGLARRKDPLGVKLLLECLESSDCWQGDVDAATETLECEHGAPLEDICQRLRSLLEQR